MSGKPVHDRQFDGMSCAVCSRPPVPASGLPPPETRPAVYGSRVTHTFTNHGPSTTSHGHRYGGYDLARSGDGGRAKSHLCVGEPEAVP